MSTLRVMVIGSGMLGHKLLQELRDRFDVWATVRRDQPVYGRAGLPRSDRLLTGVDATAFDTVERAVGQARPDAVINAVGVVKQLPEGGDPIVSITVNSLFPHMLAQLCARAGARLIHVSTDCVFSGRGGMYTEDDEPDPQDLYGRTKLLGEVEGPGALTVRTSIIGRELKGGHGLVEWFLANRGGRVKGFRRAVFSGLPTVTLAGVLGDVIEFHRDLAGLYHVAAEPIDKYRLLCLLRDAYEVPVEIEPSDDVHVDRSLDGSRFAKATGFKAPAWPDMAAAMASDPTPYDELRR